MKRFAFVLALILFAPASSALAQSLDTLYTARARAPERGVVTGVSSSEVEFDQQGTRRKIPVNEIEKVYFAHDPNELKKARDAALAGRYEDALAEIAKINVAEIQRAVVKQDVAFFNGFAQARLALAGGGDKKQAASSMITFINENPQSFHYYEACKTVGDLAVAMEKYAPAEEYYGKLLDAPWMEYKMNAAILQARAYTAQEQFAEALKRYEQVLSASVDSPEANRQKVLANVGKAACLAETDKVDEGLAILNDVIAKNDSSDSELFARAYNALGVCHINADQKKLALEAFLHTDILFFQDSDTHAESLYHLSTLWADVNKSDRAVRARSLLKSRYAGSVWAKRD